MRTLILALVLAALPCAATAQSVYPGNLTTLGDLTTFNGCTQHTSVSNGVTTTVKNSAGKYCGFVVTTVFATTVMLCYDNASALSGTIMEAFNGSGAGLRYSVGYAFANGLTCGAASGTGAVTIFWQ